MTAAILVAVSTLVTALASAITSIAVFFHVKSTTTTATPSPATTTTTTTPVK